MFMYLIRLCYGITVLKLTLTVNNKCTYKKYNYQKLKTISM